MQVLHKIGRFWTFDWRKCLKSRFFKLKRLDLQKRKLTLKENETGLNNSRLNLKSSKNIYRWSILFSFLVIHIINFVEFDWDIHSFSFDLFIFLLVLILKSLFSFQIGRNLGLTREKYLSGALVVRVFVQKLSPEHVFCDTNGFKDESRAYFDQRLLFEFFINAFRDNLVVSEPNLVIWDQERECMINSGLAFGVKFGDIKGVAKKFSAKFPMSVFWETLKVNNQVYLIKGEDRSASFQTISSHIELLRSVDFGVKGRIYCSTRGTWSLGRLGICLSKRTNLAFFGIRNR